MFPPSKPGHDLAAHSEAAELLSSLLPRVMRSLYGGSSDPAAALPLAQLKVCSILSDGPRTMSALERKLNVSLSAMTQIADRLEKARLVMREAGEGDRRVRRLSLTTRAAKMMRTRRDTRLHRTTEVLAHIEPDTREKLLHSLQALLHACGKARDNGEHSELARDVESIVSPIVDIAPERHKSESNKPSHGPVAAASATHSDPNHTHR